jgi:hypothetical protein
VGAIGLCCVDAIELDESLVTEMPQTGVVTNFTVITPVQYHGQQETEPFVRCSVMLDGTDAVLGQQSIVGIPASEVRVGMHVELVWKPEGERDTSEIGNGGHGSTGDTVEGWKPTGQPDEPAENYVDRMM